jgi:predicted NAD/FAD-binding protein
VESSDLLQRSVAVIGSGVSGLVAAYVLAQRDRVTLYEADTRLGGHAHTHRIPLPDDDGGRTVGVDSAFLVHNDRTYPTLCRLFDELGIATRETDMSMSVRDDASGLEYAGARGIGGLFPSWSSLTRPRYLLMLSEVKRFHRAALRLLESEADDATVDEFLDRHGFSRYFIDYFMTPLIAAVWSSPPGRSLEYPARYLFMFLEHHGMLSVFDSPTWRTVVGGSATYVDAVAKRIDEVRLGAEVRSVRRLPDGVEVSDAISAPRRYDAAVIATHPDQALLLLAEPTSAERSVLGAIGYSTNHAQLHTDESVLPRHRRARASWNYLATSDASQVMVTYDVTRLMRLDGFPLLVTLGGEDRVDPRTVLREMTYTHPIYTPDSVAAQRLLPTLDDNRVVFAGAYHGWGFHEDGAVAGLRAAQRLGVDWPAVARQAVPC